MIAERISSVFEVGEICFVCLFCRDVESLMWESYESSVRFAGLQECCADAVAGSRDVLVRTLDAAVAADSN